MAIPSASYTRIANTTQYAANDALSDSTHSPSALTFDGVGNTQGGGGYILGVTAITSANQTTLPQLTLYLFDGTAAPTATNDNAEFNLSDVSARNLLGTVLLNSFEAVDETSGTNGNAKCETQPEFPIRYECGAGLTDIYGLVKVENAYTPVSGERIDFRLHPLKDGQH